MVTSFYTTLPHRSPTGENIRVQVSQCLHLGTVLRTAALPTIAFPSEGFSIVSAQVRELRSSCVVVNKLRLRRLRQLIEILLRYIRVNILLETVAVSNVSANKQLGKLVI